MHGLNIFPGKKIRLKEHIYFIKELDDAWAREDSQTKNLEELKNVTSPCLYLSIYFYYTAGLLSSWLESG